MGGKSDAEGEGLRVMDDRGTTPRHWFVTLLSAALAVAAAQGCKGPVGTTAASFLINARESPDPNIRHLAYEKLGRPNAYDSPEQISEAVSVLSAALESSKEPEATRAVICRSLGALGRPQARAALVGAIDAPEWIVRSEACRALGKVGGPEDATLLARVMAADSSVDCRVAAIEALADLKPADPRIHLALADGIENTDPAIRFASLRALRTIKGQDLGVAAGPWRKQAQEQYDRLRPPESALAKRATDTKVEQAKAR